MIISIVVPVFNAEKSLEKCLTSLVKQTFKNIEIIVINDGSQDDSDKIIQKFAKKYPQKIKYVNRKNMGIGYTRNEAIRLSTGEYIGFVDSDDYVELDMYEKLYKKIVQENADIAVCNYKIFSNQNDLNTYKKAEVPLKYVTSMLKEPSIINKIDFAPWNKLYKKKLFDKIQFPENLKYEDLNTILKVFYNANKIVKVDEYGYNYYINPNGETVTINDKIYDIFYILEDLLAYFKTADKKLKRELEILCCRKLFVYTELSVKIKQLNFSTKFLTRVYTFLNHNFRNWRIVYILSSGSLKSLLLRMIQINQNIYIRRLKIKIMKVKKQK